MVNLYSKEQINTLKAYIQKSKLIVILSHSNPDGDAIGSALALYNTFSEKGVSSNVLVPNPFPDYYQFLNSSDKIYVASDKPQECSKMLKDADLIIALDFNSFSRVAELETDTRSSSAKKVLIDHHISPELSAFDLVFSETGISSSAEYLYWVLEALYGDGFSSKETAECLYTGICTDTGSFSYSCNSPSTYQVVEKLLQAGLDCEKTHALIFNSFSENRLRLLGFALSSRMKVLHEIGAAYVFLTQDDLNRFEYQIGDTEGIVNYTLNMDFVEVGVLLTEYPDKIRISFRSKGAFDVNLFARKYFNGGGHKKASGGTSSLSLKETLSSLEKLLQEGLQ